MSDIHIFIAYARKDMHYWKELKVHLRSIDRKPNIKIWYDGLIDPGAEWEESIKIHLYKANIILLLMSAHSLNSDFFYEREMKKALEQHDSGKSTVIPVILSHCLWDDPDLQLLDLQALPKDGVPITKWEHESEAYDNIARGVRQAVRVVKAKRKDAKEKAERERRAAELARQRKIEEARKKKRLEALEKEKEEKERQERIKDENRREELIKVALEEKEKLEGLRKEQAAVAKRKQQENTANRLLELEEAERKKDKETPPMINAKSERNSSWVKMGIGGVGLLFLLILGISNFTGMSKEEKAQIQKLIDDMVLVKGGTFTMGCLPERDGECHEHELPVRKVTLSDFQIGKYEVTQAQWEAIMEENPSRFSGCRNCPVEKVSWNDVQTFIQKLNQKTSKDFRLPTEAEWEFAGRGGNKSKGYKYAGGNELEKVGWYDGNSNSSTHPIGSKNSNELGLYDMSGNVWEWCADGYEAYNSSPVKNPKGAENAAYRVLRGGSWDFINLNCRSSLRVWFNPNDRDDVGFRLAK